MSFGRILSLLTLAIFLGTFVGGCERKDWDYEMALEYNAVAKAVGIAADDGADPTIEECVKRAFEETVGRPEWSSYDGAGTEFRFNPKVNEYDALWAGPEHWSGGVKPEVLIVARTEPGGAEAFACFANQTYRRIPWEDRFEEWYVPPVDGGG